MAVQIRCSLNCELWRRKLLCDWLLLRSKGAYIHCRSKERKGCARCSRGSLLGVLVNSVQRTVGVFKVMIKTTNNI